MRKNAKFTLPKRLLAVLLCAVMVAAMLPTAIRAEADTGDSRVTDPSTATGWKNMFAEELKKDTEFAGAVWTDKSVFTSLSETDFAKAIVDQVRVDEENSFIVALSALASTKEIKGYSTLPTDTMLILDLSQSMDNSDSVPSMINAANTAIKELLELNNYNRVGVAVYSGNSESAASSADTAQVLLPLGRYITGSGNNYLSYTRKAVWDTTVSVASGLKDETTGKTVSSSSKNTTGGTYMQNGLYQAWKQFEAVEDTTIATGNIQGGITRIPIIVLMTDGAPTTANSNYTGGTDSMGTSNTGTGQTTTNELGFLTQLTAAWVRAKVEEKYGREAKFYTLGLNLSSQNSEGASVAGAVLKPATSNSTIKGYWNTITTMGSGKKLTLTVPDTRWDDKTQSIPNKTVTVSSNSYLTSADQMEYVDKYFTAATASDLSSAFQSIVDEIVLQSKYYPTLVTSGEHDVDGYITFEDELGEYMEVKQIEGLVIGDQLFTGSALIDKMIAGDFGNASNWTELGQELVDSIAERLDVSYDVASTLVGLAWRDGQLGKDAAGNYSNYIGWYGDENNNYLAFWDTDHTELDKPEGAVYVNRCYGFYGQDSDIPGGDMMHIVVQLRTEITTGHQTITWKIPANLIPMVTYYVELEGDSYDSAKNITMEIDPADPIQLLFEVGLREDVNELTVEQIAEEAEKDPNHHIHKNEDGSYSFYTNRWGSGNGEEIDYTDPTTHLVTVSHYTPSVENERYYYTEDAVIYNADGTRYTGSTKPSGSGYQHIRKLFQLTGSGDEAEIVDKYMPIHAMILEQYATYDEEGGFWYIPKGAVYQQIDRFIEGKTDNTTQTLRYSDHPLVYYSLAADDYEIYDFLGNNGKLTLAPATGIILSKSVDAVAPNTSVNNFAFEIALTGVADGTVYDYTWVKADGSSASGSFTVQNGKITVTNVANGDTIYITGMAAGVAYTITEQAHADYTVSTVNGVTGTSITGTTVDKTLNEASFVNTLKEDGGLIIGKTVTHELGADYVIPSTLKFKVKVTLSEQIGTATSPYAGEKIQTSLGEKTTGTDGSVTFELGNDQSVSITGLPEGTLYTIEEINYPTYFTPSYTNQSGSIQAGSNAVAWVSNAYHPDAAVPSIQVVGTKSIKDGNFTDCYAFQFVLEQWDGAKWGKVAKDTVSNADTDYDFSDAVNEISFNAVGTYYFRVYEDDTYKNVDHIIYDTAKKYFSVVVTDTDMDGKLEISSVTNAVKNDSGNYAFTFRADVENVYSLEATASITLPISKVLTNATSIDVPLDNFSFALYENGNKIDGSEVTMGQSGKTSLSLTYASSILDDVQADENNVKTKTFEYQLKEVIPAEADKVSGVDYSKDSYKVVVTLKDDGDGSFTAEAKMYTSAGDEVDLTNADNSAVFTNKFDPTDAEAVISGTKKLTNTDPKGVQDLLGSYTFEFELYEADKDFNIGKLLDTASSDKDGRFAFNTLTYSDIGRNYYVVKEKAGSETEIGYDGSYYLVTVTVSQDPDDFGKLTATTHIDEFGADNNTSIEFENTYTPAATSITLGGTKVLEGRTQRHGEFTFELKDEAGNVIDTAVNAANTGKFQFGSIEYTKAGTYKYTISEVTPEKDAEPVKGVTYDRTEYTVTVTVTDNGTGNLNAAAVYAGGASDSEAKFTNRYTTNPVTVTIKADKTLTGRDLKDGEFQFAMYPADADFTAQDSTDWTASNVGKEVTLTKTFDKTGVYYYVLKEVSDDPLGGITYDSAQYNLIITIFDNGDGQLRRTINYVVAGQSSHYDENSSEPFAFTNAYTTSDAKITLSGKKTLTGRALKDGEFTFVLQEVDASGAKLGDPASVTNTDGVYSFDLEYKTAGTHYYELSESAENPVLDVVYDETVYKITVTVTDDGKGTLTAEAAYQNAKGETVTSLDFTNTYDYTLTEKDIIVEIPVKKTVKSTYGMEVGLKDFQFSLQGVDDKGAASGKALTVKTDANGDAKFTLSYSEEDIGKTFTYTLTETDTGIKDMVYSTDSYTITIAVGLGEDGKTLTIDADVTKDGKAAQAIAFENVYNGQKPVNNSPATGEDVQILLVVLVMLVSAAAIVALVLYRRRSSGK